jgi:hypothetical protein
MVRHTRKRGGWWWSKKTNELSNEELSNDLREHVRDDEQVKPIQTTRKKCNWYEKLRGCKEYKIEDQIGYVKKEKPCRWYNPFSRNCQKSKSHMSWGDGNDMSWGGSRRNRRSHRTR